MAVSPARRLFKVRFVDPVDKQPVDITVEHVGAGAFFGMVTLSGFVFNDNKKMVILPEEDAARKRFGKTQTLHIPYHHLIYVEEFDELPMDVKNLPFLHPVDSLDDSHDQRGH